MKRNYLSVHDEPALSAKAQADPSEFTAATLQPQEEIDRIRDSALNEPHFGDTERPEAFRAWTETRRAATTRSFSLLLTIVAGLVAGLFAVIGALVTGNPSFFAVIYILLFGPIVEEILKQAGMIYLLERRPYNLFAGWQFPLAAILAALVFASIENHLYIYRFAAFTDDAARVAEFALFRWKVCTALHVGCAIVASFGLRRAWREQTESGRPADLSLAFPLFTVAIVIHGIYNLWALFWTDIF